MLWILRFKGIFSATDAYQPSKLFYPLLFFALFADFRLLLFSWTLISNALRICGFLVLILPIMFFCFSGNPANKLVERISAAYPLCLKHWAVVPCSPSCESTWDADEQLSLTARYRCRRFKPLAGNRYIIVIQQVSNSEWQSWSRLHGFTVYNGTWRKL